MTDLLLSSGNKNKKREFNQILKSAGFNVIIPSDIGMDVGEIVEDADTFEGNAFKKADYLHKLVKVPVIADDSGLSVDALGGAPGIYSARYAGEFKDDEENINKLLTNLQGVKKEDRTAQFVCAICMIFPNGEKIETRGTVKGKIAFEKKGESGFGYDPIFLFNDDKTFAQMSAEEKNKISHRKIALEKLLEKLKEREI
ncbi:MAG: XTP/dITP diphosphatase [Clostridia bacterium]|nr:XTP/dITP diphosphatase [Clostridia bacterium]